ncbi:hypothetical protein HNQ56_002083 [Anaerotaenia torta]|uniref:polysaccharide pyruvyl transferase family protein n=1 Tax=Anaerotaenia torta TaxID=433293 RepID=UPI003D1F3140
MLNIGDPIQTYAMKYLYSLMNVQEKDLIEVSRYHARDYEGEEVVLPFNAFNMIYNQFGHPYGTLPVSSKIIPVFISFHLHTRHFNEDILIDFMANQPIGCRDEETMKNMQNHGIQAYLTGCVTALLPRRDDECKGTKTFFVDVPGNLMEFIPKHLLEGAEFVEHQIPFERTSDNETMAEDEYQRFYQLGISQLQKYRDEAALVVTSRLHAASPCMAMGIPVILVADNFDGRFAWLDKFLPLYTPEQFGKIDWNPTVVDYEEEKNRMIDIILRQIRNKYQQVIDTRFIDGFYGKRRRNIYNKGYLDEIRNLPLYKEKKVKYAVWGVIAQAQALIHAIDDGYPNWELRAVIDKSANGAFEGIEIQHPSSIVQLDSDIVYFVLPEVAHDDAKALLTMLGRKYVLVSKYRMKYCE